MLATEIVTCTQMTWGNKTRGLVIKECKERQAGKFDKMCLPSQDDAGLGSGKKTKENNNIQDFPEY